jgi:large subunit ribosomal protein L18e
VKQVRTTNPELIKLIRFLRQQSKENQANIWRDIAERLARSNKQRIAVNLSRLNRYTQKNEMVVVPGKVLGSEIGHPIRVAAFAFSETAKEKIAAARGKHMSFSDLIKKNPKGSNVKIIG